MTTKTNGKSNHKPTRDEMAEVIQKAHEAIQAEALAAVIRANQANLEAVFNGQTGILVTDADARKKFSPELRAIFPNQGDVEVVVIARPNLIVIANAFHREYAKRIAMVRAEDVETVPILSIAFENAAVTEGFLRTGEASDAAVPATDNASTAPEIATATTIPAPPDAPTV